jgi:hypothetical protein
MHEEAIPMLSVGEAAVSSERASRRSASRRGVEPKPC